MSDSRRLSALGFRLEGTSKVQFADEGLHQRTGWRPVRSTPVCLAGKREEPFLLKVFLEHVEAFAQKRNRIGSVTLLQQAKHDGGVAKGERRHREGNRRAHRISRVRAEFHQRRAVRRSSVEGTR